MWKCMIEDGSSVTFSHVSVLTPVLQTNHQLVATSRRGVQEQNKQRSKQKTGECWKWKNRRGRRWTRNSAIFIFTGRLQWGLFPKDRRIDMQDHALYNLGACFVKKEDTDHIQFTFNFNLGFLITIQAQLSYWLVAKTYGIGCYSISPWSTASSF